MKPLLIVFLAWFGGVCCASIVLAIVYGNEFEAQLSRSREIRSSYEKAEQAYKSAISILQQRLAECTATPSSSQLSAIDHAVHTEAPIEVLNLVRPGLGDLVFKLEQQRLADKIASEAGQCPAGSRPETSESWQGYKCVAQ